MKQDPSRGGGSTLSPAYSAALEALAKKRKENNEDKPWYEDVAGAIGGALKYVYDNAPSSNPVSTPVNMGGGTVSMGGQGTGKSLVTEPARLAVRRAVGDVTAIPGVGEPSSSYTADQVRQQGVVRGVVGAALDYSQFLPVVVKGTRVAGDVVNASKLAAMERRANPFPALRGEMSNVIDVVEGSRLPATVVETPSNPYRTTRNALAEDMAQAQVPRPTVAPATISPRLEVPTMAPTVPDMPPGFPLPEVPSNMTLLDFQRMPEYQAYIEAGQSIDPRAMAGFAFDPETAYLVHSGRGQLIGGKLDPYRTLSGLNDSHTRAVLRGRDRAIASADVLQDQLDTFVRTGVWNGDELAQRMPPGYSSEGGKFPLNGVVKASDMSEQQLQEFVDRIQTRINEHTDFYSSVEPFAALARREPFLSYYPAPVGGKSGYMGWHSGPEGGGMYLAAVPADRATTLFGPGIYEKRLGVPEWQAFGEQTPIASIRQFPQDWSGYTKLEAATRAFAVQKTIEDRMRRGFYGRAEGRRLIPEVTAPQAGRTMNPVEKLASAQTNLEIAKAAQRQAREAIGIEVQDIDFPSPLGATDLLRVDATDYGVFRTDGSAWEDLGSQQISAGINVENLPNEMASMRQYFSNDYENFQDYLRGHTANDQVRAHVQNIDRVFAATPPTTRKFKVFRGVRSGSGSPNSEYVGAFYRSLQRGQLIVEPAYLSTSISQGFASEWASANMDDILLVIDVPEGSVAINPITSWKRGLDEIDDHLYAPEEQELLFNRGTVLRVTQNDGNVIRAEIVPAHEVSTSPLSTSDIKQSLLDRYSYKQLAEMVQDGEQKYQFYEAFLKDDEELQKMVSKLRWPESGIKDVARMIADLRLDAFDDVGDYEAFRDAAFLFEDDDGMLAAGKKLLTFLKKRQLLEPEMLTFIKNNLEEIIDY